MNVDPEGQSWWHWAFAAAVVGVAAVAVVATAGGAAPALLAVAAIANVCAATTAASTIAAGAFIGSSMALGASAITVATNSQSAKDFSDQGNWGTVVGTATGAIVGGIESGISYAEENGVKVKQVGRLKPSNKNGNGQLGIKYQINKANGKPTIKSFEFHYNHSHKGYIPHWQQNTWNPINDSIGKANYWTWWGKRI